MSFFWQVCNKLHYTKYSVHFRSVKSLGSVQFFATAWISSRQAFLPVTNLAQTLIHRAMMPSIHVIFCYPLICWLAYRVGLKTRKTKPWLGAWNFQLSCSRKGRGARNWVNNVLSPHEEASIKSPNCIIPLFFPLSPVYTALFRLDKINKGHTVLARSSDQYYITT